MKQFTQSDIIHFDAAEGWLELGDWLSANEELDQITPELRAHPAVLFLRYIVFSDGEKWDGAVEIAKTLTRLLPDDPAGWTALAHSTRRKTGGGIRQARDILTEAEIKFPADYRIQFYLACYESQLGNLQAAKKHLNSAFNLAGENDIRLQALEDADLEPLWKDIGNA